MTFTRAIAAMLATTLLLATVGGGIGYALGRFVPGYYRGVFRDGHRPQFDPISMGVGQGLTQGAAGGVVAGLALVALLCWRDVRLARATGDTQTTARRGDTAGCLLRVTGMLLLLVACSATSLILGRLGGERSVYHRRYLEERDALAPVLANDASFSAVELVERSDGGAGLVGEVPSPPDLDRLRAATARAVGEARAEEALTGITVSRDRQ